MKESGKGGDMHDSQHQYHFALSFGVEDARPNDDLAKARNLPEYEINIAPTGMYYIDLHGGVVKPVTCARGRHNNFLREW